MRLHNQTISEIAHAFRDYFALNYLINNEMLNMLCRKHQPTITAQDFNESKFETTAVNIAKIENIRKKEA